MIQGLILFVPHGNAEYRARPPAFYDGTYTFFGFGWHSGTKQGAPNTQRSVAQWLPMLDGKQILLRFVPAVACKSLTYMVRRGGCN